MAVSRQTAAPLFAKARRGAAIGFTASSQSLRRGLRRQTALNMAVRNKTFIPNEIYFITFTILGWKRIFINDKYCDLVYKWFDYMKEKYQNKIYGYVIMPNHIHCLIKITDKSPKLSIFITNAKRFLAYQIVQLLEEDIQANHRPALREGRGVSSI